MNSYMMTPLPRFESRCQARYSQMSPVSSAAVSSHTFLRSTCELGLVGASIGKGAVWTTPSLVLLEFSGPSSEDDPEGSVNLTVRSSGTVPSMTHGDDVRGSANEGACEPTMPIASAIAAMAASPLRERLRIFISASGDGTLVGRNTFRVPLCGRSSWDTG